MTLSRGNVIYPILNLEKTLQRGSINKKLTRASEKLESLAIKRMKFEPFLVNEVVCEKPP